MALNAAIIMPPLQQVIFDKTLDTFLSDGTVYFWEDSNRTIPKNVYELTGTGPGSYIYVSLGAVLTLSGIGSFIDSSGGNIAIYLWPFTGTPNDNPPSQTIDNYYITVYSSTGVFQFDIPNWPGVVANESPINTADTTENIISNGQFVTVDFPASATSSSPFVITTTGANTSTEIAPGWSMVTTGSGSFSVYQQQIIDNTAPGNPAFALGIAASSGYTQPLLLTQTFEAPRLLVGQYVSGTFIVESTNGGSYTISMNYTPSLTNTPQLICTGVTVPGGGFQVIANSSPIQITNPGSGTGTVRVTISIPVGAQVQISCVQLCGVASNVEVVDYLNESPEREIDHLFHYYEPQLAYKPIPSLLTGWDFPSNPLQFFYLTQTVLAATPAYVLDQTIIGCSSSSVVCTYNVGTGALVVTTGANTQAFYLLQYLSKDEAIQTILDSLSVNINAYASATGVLAKVYLYYSTGGGTIPALSGGTIGAIASDGTFTLTAANWTAIPQSPGFANNVPLSVSELQDIPLSGWNASATNFGIATASNFAIVVTFTVPTSGTFVNLNSISCVAGHIATPPAPLTASQVLTQCQYYFNKSFITGPNGTQLILSAGINSGESYGIQVVGNDGMGHGLVAFGPIINYPVMRATPNITLFNPIAANQNIANITGSSNWTASSAIQITVNGFVTTGTTNAGSAAGDLSGVHWRADARLGVV